MFVVAGAIAQRWRRMIEEGLSPGLLAAVTAILVIGDVSFPLAGNTVLPGGPLDEMGHAGTTVIVFGVLGTAMRRRFLAVALPASVLIDADHVPGSLGYDFLTKGTPRPYTHSLLTILAALVIAAAWRRRRDIFLAIAIGVTLHLFRDLAENSAGVSLLWPYTDHAYTYSHTLYRVIMGALVIAAAVRYRLAARVRSAGCAWQT